MIRRIAGLHFPIFPILICLLTGCDQPSTSLQAPVPQVGEVTTKRLLNMDKEPGEWLTGGRGYKQRY